MWQKKIASSCPGNTIRAKLIERSDVSVGMYEEKHNLHFT